MAYIDREKFLKKIAECFGYFGVMVKAIEEIADECTDADVVKIVRCKDCVAREEFEPNKFHCANTGYYCGENGYCSDGVRTPKERGADNG